MICHILEAILSIVHHSYLKKNKKLFKNLKKELKNKTWQYAKEPVISVYSIAINKLIASNIFKNRKIQKK